MVPQKRGICSAKKKQIETIRGDEQRGSLKVEDRERA
jgi:hypothetical protein